MKTYSIKLEDEELSALVDFTNGVDARSMSVTYEEQVLIGIVGQLINSRDGDDDSHLLPSNLGTAHDDAVAHSDEFDKITDSIRQYLIGEGELQHFKEWREITPNYLEEIYNHNYSEKSGTIPDDLHCHIRKVRNYITPWHGHWEGI